MDVLRLYLHPASAIKEFLKINQEVFPKDINESAIVLIPTISLGSLKYYIILVETTRSKPFTFSDHFSFLIMFVFIVDSTQYMYYTGDISSCQI